jgi:hypothetical protein
MTSGRLPPSRDQLAAMCRGDADLIRQTERLYSLVGGTDVPAAVPMVPPADVTLDPAGALTVASAGVQPGVYSVDLLALLDITGGGGGDGVNIDVANSRADLVGLASFGVVVADAGGTLGTIQSTTAAPAFVTAISVVRISGVVGINFPGTIGFSFQVTGAPGACVLKAGSGLTLLRLS